MVVQRVWIILHMLHVKGWKLLFHKKSLNHKNKTYKNPRESTSQNVNLKSSGQKHEHVHKTFLCIAQLWRSGWHFRLTTNVKAL